MLPVHVRITAQDNGQPVPARLRLHAAGKDQAPLGRESLPPGLILGSQQHHYVEGACEALLPPGPILLEASRGPEWRPARREVMLAPGQLALRLTLERAFRWDQRGWHSGDTRIAGMSPHAARLEGKGEGLSVAHLLARDGDDNLLAFSGTGSALPEDECLVAVNTFNAHDELGAVALLNCHRPVFPLAASLERDWAVREWCGQCHRKKGLVVWPGHPGQPEALACLLLGEVDAFEVGPGLDGWPLFELLLRCGVRAALAGGSGKASPARAVGEVRTYVHCPEGLTLPAWIEGLRAGKSFVTTGPLLDFSYRDGVLRAEACSLTPLTRLELIAGGEVVAATSSGQAEVAFRPEVTTWVAARCLAEGGGWAHTSPLWVDVPARPWRVRQADLDDLRGMLAQGEAYAARLPEKRGSSLRQTLREAAQAVEARG